MRCLVIGLITSGLLMGEDSQATGGRPIRTGRFGPDQNCETGTGQNFETAQELHGQTAMRAGPWKLVLDGRPAEGDEVIAPVWLSHLGDDPGEGVNLAEREAARCADMVKRARAWRAGVETEWEREFASGPPAGTTGRTG